jgi:hypothetical protein
MALAKSRGYWFWRDVRPGFALLVWTAFAISLVTYFYGPVTIFKGQQVSPRPTNTRQSNDDVLFTGSIVFLPARGDQCWQRMIDNRTGAMWDKGYINCYDAVLQLIEQKQNGIKSSAKMNAISHAFRHSE